MNSSLLSQIQGGKGLKKVADHEKKDASGVKSSGNVVGESKPKPDTRYGNPSKPQMSSGIHGMHNELASAMERRNQHNPPPTNSAGRRPSGQNPVTPRPPPSYARGGYGQSKPGVPSGIRPGVPSGPRTGMSAAPRPPVNRGPPPPHGNTGNRNGSLAKGSAPPPPPLQTDRGHAPPPPMHSRKPYSNAGRGPPPPPPPSGGYSQNDLPPPPPPSKNRFPPAPSQSFPAPPPSQSGNHMPGRQPPPMRGAPPMLPSSKPPAMDTQSSGGFDSRFRFQPISSLPPPEKYVQPKISDFPSKSQSHQHAPPPRQAPPPPVR